MISLYTCQPSHTLSEIFAHASRAGRISRADHSKLIAALMENDISEEEKNSIKRLLYAVRRNRIRVEGNAHFFLSISNIAS